MKVQKFGLGIRFDLLQEELTADVERRLWEEVFSVLTASDVHNLRLHADVTEQTSLGNENIYQCILTNGKFQQMKKIYAMLSEDAGIDMHLASQHPFVQTNFLLEIKEPRYLGQVQRDGSLEGGEGLPGGVHIPKKRGKRRPVGKGVKILLAPGEMEGSIASREAIKRLTSAARRHFMGVKVVPVPVCYTGRGAVNAAVVAADGVLRKVSLRDIMDQKEDFGFGVLYGKTAVIELYATEGKTTKPREPVRGTSFGAGEIIRRALDEGLREILIAVDDYYPADCGMGIARALGVKFFDEADNELLGAPEDLGHVCKIDLEYLHPGVLQTRFRAMCTNGTNEGEMYAQYAKAYGEASVEPFRRGTSTFHRVLREAMSVEADTEFSFACCGTGLLLESLFRARFDTGIDAYFNAIDFDGLLRGVSLAVTATERLERESMEKGSLLPVLLERCRDHNVPVAMVAGCVDSEVLENALLSKAAIMPAINAPMSRSRALENAGQLLDEAADRMFQFIRIGRDVEKLGVRRIRRPGPRLG
ncbi:MAG: glycerate kinase [Bacillota bacterium]